MSIEAHIWYHLSERGRRDSLRQGGNGSRHQEMTGSIESEQLDSFQVDQQGRVFFDARRSPATFEPVQRETKKWHTMTRPNRKGLVVQASYEVEWDVAPSWSDLLDFVRWAEGVFEDELNKSEDDQREQQIEEAFLTDPTARADKVSEDYVEIKGFTFWTDRIVREAKERSVRDLEERRQANRATLTRWIREHGTQNQRQRLAESLLPWDEAHAELEKHLFAPLERFPQYARFEVSDICICDMVTGEETCGLKFQSVDATQLTAEEWDRLSEIRAVVPDAQFQIREHRAKCRVSTGAKMKRGVIVKRAVDQLKVKREYALGGVHDVEGF